MLKARQARREDQAGTWLLEPLLAAARPGPAAAAAGRRRVPVRCPRGDFAGLLQVLAPEVMLRFDPGAAAPLEITGTQAAARHILRTAPRWLPYAIPVTVNGTPNAQYGTWTSLFACSGSPWHTARSPNSAW
jgi:hypothetical protein